MEESNYHSTVTFTAHHSRYHRMLQLVLLYCFYCHYVKGIVTQSPSGIVSVCSEGHLELMCSTTGTFLRWYTRPNIENEASSRTYTRTLSSLLVVNNVEPLMISNITFSFSRTSIQDSLPLVTRLVISPVSEILNGTEVKCEDVILGINSSTTTILVIESALAAGNITDHEVEISYSEHFYGDSVTIILNLSDENPLVSFNISVIPRLPKSLLGNVHVPATTPLQLLYNTHYNISVVAFLCGQVIATNSVALIYSSCKNPSTYSGEFLTIMGYMIPAREGTNITLNCSAGLELIGPNMSTCMGNGEWEPYLTEVECFGSVNDDVSGSSQTVIVNIAVGILIPVTLGITVTIIIGTVLLLTMTGIIKCPERKQRVNRQIEECSESDLKDYQVQSGTLVYAELGPSLFEQQLAHTTSAIDLDDSHVEYAKINHSECRLTQPRLLQNPEVGHEIPSINLDNLLIQIRVQVTPKWCNFGEAVGIDKNVLDNFAKHCSPEECVVEMLDYWLRSCTKQPTWNDVAKILDAIGLPQLAFKVSTTSKLPVEAHNEVPQLNAAAIVESPPPIPPKMDKKDPEAISLSTITERPLSDEAPAPALPPKSNINTLSFKMPFIPPRPPKP